MSNDSTAVDFGINLLEEEIDDVIFRTNEFLTDATFTGGQGPFWWLLKVVVIKRFDNGGTFSISITCKLVPRDRISRRDKTGTKLAEKPFFSFSCHVQHFKYRCLHLQRYTFVPKQTQVCPQKFDWQAIFHIFCTDKGHIENSKSPFVVEYTVYAHFMPEKSYSNEVSKLNEHKSYFALFTGISEFSIPIVEPTIGQMSEPTSATRFYNSLHTPFATYADFILDENQ